MALTGRRWITIALVGCLALVVVYWPGTEASDQYPTFVDRRHEAAEFRQRLIGDAGRGLALLQLRDHVLDSLQRHGYPKSPVTIQSADAHNPQAVQRLNELAASAGRFLTPQAPSVPTLVLSHQDTKYRLPNGDDVSLPGSWYVMPGATAGRICLVVALDVRQFTAFLLDSSSQSAMNRRTGLAKVLGPCGFYSAFGPPGPEIERWLRAQDYIVAGHADWDVNRKVFDRTPPTEFLGTLDLWQVLRGASSGAFDMGFYNLAARACAHGQLDQCRKSIMPVFADLRPPLGGRYALSRQWWWASEVGTNFLADLVRMEGRERFTRFWRSALPVDQAFQSAYGLSLEQWTQRWVLSYVDQPRFGPSVQFTSVLVGLALALLFGGVASLYAMRRQVG